MMEEIEKVQFELRKYGYTLLTFAILMVLATKYTSVHMVTPAGLVGGIGIGLGLASVIIQDIPTE